MKSFREFLNEGVDLISGGLATKLKAFMKNHTLLLRKSSLGQEDTLILTFMSDTKANALNGIIENSPSQARFRISPVGTDKYEVELFQKRGDLSKFRKRKVTAEKVIADVAKWFNDNRKVLTIKNKTLRSNE